MSLLPPNSTPLERAIASVSAFDVPVPIATLWDPHACPEHLLPWLAWALSITDAEGWRLASTTQQKRDLLARSIELHRKKGTLYSIQQALQMMGFNDVEIVERLDANLHDGHLSYDGTSHYDAYGWAQFRLAIEAGDDQAISEAHTRLIVETANEWKPARSHLVDVQNRASTTDTVTVDDECVLTGFLTAEDTLPWGQTYDGSMAHSQGDVHEYTGALLHDGSIRYVPYRANGILYDSIRDGLGMSAVLGMADIQSRLSVHDAGALHSGILDYGASAPVAEDAVMPITVTRHLRYDGRIDYAAHSFDGSFMHDATLVYINTPHRGDVQTYLEA